MKLRKLKVALSMKSLTDAEMKNVIGGVQTSSEGSCPVGSVCYDGIYQGNYAWRIPGYGNPECYCSCPTRP